MTDESRQLFTRATTGDAGAVDALIERHLPALQTFVRLEAGAWLQKKESCADLVQSACREVLADIGDYRYDSEGGFRHWLFTAALRKIRDRARYWRAEKRDVRREAQTPSPAGSTASDFDLMPLYAGFATPSRGAIERESVERFERVFAALSDDYRDVIVKKVIVGMKYPEIAASYEKDEAAVRKTYSRATARLMRLLREDEASRET